MLESKPSELLALHGSHLERGLPVVVARRRSAATGAYLHTADGNTMAESRCTPAAVQTMRRLQVARRGMPRRLQSDQIENGP